MKLQRKSEFQKPTRQGILTPDLGTHPFTASLVQRLLSEDQKQNSADDSRLSTLQMLMKAF